MPRKSLAPLLVFFFGLIAPAGADEPAADAAAQGDATGAVATRPTDKQKKPPEPKEIELTTKDGVVLHATWYASISGRETPPLILLHAYRGSRADYADFALFLQREQGFAVIVPDLRGHGDSIVQTEPGGVNREIHVDRLNPDDFMAMAGPGGDVETVKRFLIQRNNAKELNIERLGLIGAEMGALVAAEWAFYDWEIDNLPTVKQGSDVKALALISPDVQFKKLRAAALAEMPICGQVGLQIIAGGEDAHALRAARQVHHLVKRCYAEPPADAPIEVVREQQKLFLDVGYPTSLQGTKMLGEKLGLEQRIARFFGLRVVQPSIPWHERKGPL